MKCITIGWNRDIVVWSKKVLLQLRFLYAFRYTAWKPMIGEFKLCCYWNALCSHTTLLFVSFLFLLSLQAKKPICHPCQLLSTIHSLTWHSLWWSGSLLKSCPWTILFGCGIYAPSLSFAKLLPLVCSSGWCGEWSRRMVSLYKRIIGSWFIDNGSRPNTTALCGTC